MKHDNSVYSAQFSADGQRVVTASRDNTARVWDAATGRAISEPMKHDNSVYSAQFSADGQRVVTASQDKTARVWDAATGRAISEPMQHDNSVYSAQFSADGQRVVTASQDKTARVWDAATGKAIREPMKHDDVVSSAQFSADGQRVVTAFSDKTARVWDTATGRAISEPMKHDGEVRSAQFSADGQRVVTASDDRTARVWDAATGKALSEPMKHDGVVRSAQFSADGQRVVTASFDRTARVWDIPTITAKDSAADVNLLTDLAEATAGLDLQAFGQTEILAALTPDQVKATREKIAAKFVRTSSNLTPLQRLMKWSVSERRSRTISPLSEMTVAEWVENRIKDGTLDGLRAAVEVDPTNARLAAHFGGALADYALIEGTDPAEAGRARAEADFQTRRALKLAPDNDEVKAITQNNLGTALYNQGIRTEGAKAAELLAEAVAAYRSALEIYTRERQPQDWARSQDNLGGALYELGTRSGAEEGRKLLEDAIAAYRSALEVFTKADLPQSWAATQNNLGIALRELGNQLEEKEGLKLKRESVELLRDVVSYQPDDLSRYRLASALGDLAFMLVLDSQFAEAQARCEEAQRLVNEIGDGIQKTDRDNLVAIQGNLAHALLFHGHYDEALAIYRKYWDKPLNGKTFRDATLEDFAAFDKAGLTHPDLSRMKLALRHLRSEAPSP